MPLRADTFCVDTFRVDTFGAKARNFSDGGVRFFWVPGRGLEPEACR